MFLLNRRDNSKILIDKTRNKERKKNVYEESIKNDNEWTQETEGKQKSIIYY